MSLKRVLMVLIGIAAIVGAGVLVFSGSPDRIQVSLAFILTGVGLVMLIFHSEFETRSTSTLLLSSALICIGIACIIIGVVIVAWTYLVIIVTNIWLYFSSLS